MVKPEFPALKFPLTAVWLPLVCMLSVTELAGAVTRALVVAHVSHEKRAAGLHWNGPVPTAWSVALSPAHAYTLSLTTLTVHWARATKDTARIAALKIQRMPKVPTKIHTAGPP